MSKTLTGSDRKKLIRLASTLPKGSEERRTILSGLKKTAKGWTRSFIYQGVDSQTGRHEYTLESMTRVVTHEVRVKEEWDAMARALAKSKKLKKEGWGRGGMNRYEGMVGNEMEIRAWKGYIRIAVSVSWGGEGKPPTVQLWR